MKRRADIHIVYMFRHKILNNLLLVLFCVSLTDSEVSRIFSRVEEKYMVFEVFSVKTDGFQWEVEAEDGLS